jgi:Ni/Co efflux regulator RcnB
MRVLAIATILALSSTAFPALAQQTDSRRPQAVPVQPERTPQQADQVRSREKTQGTDVKIGSGWRMHKTDKDRNGQGKTGAATDQDHRTVGQNWRMHEK